MHISIYNRVAVGQSVCLKLEEGVEKLNRLMQSQLAKRCTLVSIIELLLAKLRLIFCDHLLTSTSFVVLRVHTDRP